MEYKIKRKLVSEIFHLLNKNSYFKSNDYIVNVSFEETNKFSTKIKRPSDKKRELIIKYPTQNNDREFYDKLEKYLKDEYTFDLFIYSFKNDMDMIETCTIFSILHEFGHVIEYIDRLNNGGDYLNRDEMIELSRYWEVSKIQNLDERFYYYRKIDKEAIADRNAIDIMKKFSNELKTIIRVS